MIRTYPVGDAITASATFFDEDTAVPRNPDTVILRLRDPNGTETITPNVTNPRVGFYRCVFIPRVPGNWAFRWEASGGVDAAIENHFEVRPSAFTSTT